MNTDSFVKLYKDRGYDDKSIDKAVAALLEAENYYRNRGVAFNEVDTDIAKSYVKKLIDQNKNDLGTLLAVARYFYVTKNDDVYIYFTKILGGLGVLENIKNRMEVYAGKETAEKILEGYKMPPLGTPVEEVPKYTHDLMERIKGHLEPNLYRKILAGNNHGIPKDAMKLEKEFYENSNSLDDYLKERHQRKVEELQSYCDSSTVWFEQIITQDVVDFVAGNQELLSAKRKGNKLYVTKIPYDAVKYLRENNSQKNLIMHAIVLLQERA